MRFFLDILTPSSSGMLGRESIANLISKTLFRKVAKEREKAEIDSKIVAAVALIKEKDRERELLRNKLKETRAVEVQVNELRTQVKKNETTMKSKMEQGKDFEKERAKIVDRSKVSTYNVNLAALLSYFMKGDIQLS